MNVVHVNGKPVVPSKIVCIGRNYVEHIKELGNEIPEEMVVFLKPNSSLTETLHSNLGAVLHYEGELSFLVENNSFSAVAFGLDLTKREVQSKLKAKGLPWERAKAFDGSALFSDFVAVPAGASLSMELEINGRLIQSANTSLMMYKPNEILAELLTFMTLNDGDVVMTGTPKGVGVIQTGDEFSGCIKANDELLVRSKWLVK